MMWEFIIALFVVTSSIVQDATTNPRIKPLSPKEIEEFSKFLEKTSVMENADKVPADDNAWVNSGKFEGDMILGKDQRQKIAAIVGKTGRAVATNIAHLWPSKNIPYIIKTDDFNSSQLAAIKDVLHILETESCLTFNEVSTNVKDVIVIGGKYRGCFASVGRRGGKQIVNFDKTHSVGRGCFKLGAVAHELFHALGFFHTHSRMDRDDYVKIVWENVKEGRENNFKKYTERFSNLDGRDLLEYDYYSIMHYPKTAFSKNMEDTIVPLKTSTTFIGQRLDIFQGDLIKLNALYCNDTRQSRPESTWKRPRDW